MEVLRCLRGADFSIRHRAALPQRRFPHLMTLSLMLRRDERENIYHAGLVLHSGGFQAAISFAVQPTHYKGKT